VEIFKESTKKVAKLNSLSPKGSAHFANNSLSDLKDDEYLALMGFRAKDAHSSPKPAADFVEIKNDGL